MLPASQAGGEPIAALSTPWGHSALALVRVSGAGARERVAALCPGGPPWRPRRASLRVARSADGAELDALLCTWLPGPRSPTGEDVVELSCHGNPLLIEALLDRLAAVGARPARPGEFTRRAVENGVMDLIGAEALLARIEARSAAGLDAARAAGDGRLRAELEALRQRLLDLCAELEVRLDHPGEELGEADDAEVAAALRALAADAGALAGTWALARPRLEGARVALVGEVNAGKSSLFNHLVGERRALVSPEPGTTRDVIERAVRVEGLELLFFDTAGERDAAGLEAEGQALGQALTREVDLRLQVFAADRPPAALWPGAWLVATHADRAPPPAEVLGQPVRFAVDNTTGAGVPALRAALRSALGADPGGARALLISQRQHGAALELQAGCLAAAAALLGPAGPVVAAEEATRALLALSALSGDDAREDVLDRLFARFCVGK